MIFHDSKVKTMMIMSSPTGWSKTEKKNKGGRMKGKEWAGVKERKRKVKTRFLSGETPLPNMIKIICFWLCISLEIKKSSKLSWSI